MPDQRAVLRITNKEYSANVVTREIGAHIEFAWISRRRDNFRLSEKPQFIAQFRGAAPTNLLDRARRLFSAFKFN